MTTKKVNLYLSLIFVMALGLSIFILRYASNWLTQSSQELISLRSEVAELNSKQVDLDKAKKALSDNATELDTLSRVLPDDKDQARVIQEITALADQANITIDSVGFPSSTLGATVAPKPAVTTETTTSTQPATTSAEPAPAPVKSVSQATPVKEIPGVQSIELSIGTISSKDTSIKGVRYEEMMKLIKLIERNRRTLQIRSIGIGQNAVTSGEPTYNLSLSLVIFIQP